VSLRSATVFTEFRGISVQRSRCIPRLWSFVKDERTHAGRWPAGSACWVS